MTTDPEIQVFEQFATLVETYPDILSKTRGEIFYTPTWFDLLWKYANTFAGPARYVVVKISPQASPVCFPLIAGKRLAGMSNYYASLFGPIGDPAGAAEPVCQALAGWIREQAQRWSSVDFHPLDTQHPFYRNMARALKTQAYRVDSYACFGNWYFAVDGKSYADYLASRPSRLRNTIRRGLVKAQKAGALEIVIHQNPGLALENAIADYLNVYRKSWKPVESHPQFISGLCRQSAHEGWLRLGILKLDKEAVAAQIWLVHADKANIYKLAYVQGKNPFSAGTLLTAEMTRHAIDVDRVSEIDYLTGDDAYKQDWMSARRERRGLVGFNLRRTEGVCQYARHYFGKLAKSVFPSNT
ncbi:MAG: GNAT family N-acetyltransferase [Candidatus Accumulibacter sp.]|nr:GNAT family N-acetyltransferase [Accumulibacter sp.]